MNVRWVRRGLSVMLCLLLMGCAWHLNFHEGIHDFQAHRYHDAFVRLKPEAISGEPAAQYAIGYMYYYGQGIVEDRSKAIYWIQRAACAGFPEAQEAMKLIAVEYTYACGSKSATSS